MEGRLQWRGGCDGQGQCIDGIRGVRRLFHSGNWYRFVPPCGFICHRQIIIFISCGSLAEHMADYDLDQAHDVP